MDDAVVMPCNANTLNMGATSNLNNARLVTLQERRKSIEEALCRKEKELKELCLQEAAFTGIIPSEMPLQPGESPPTIRRKIGTSYLLPESLLQSSNNKDETISDLELQLQLHANMAEAALGLAHKQNLSKTVRKQHKTEYQHHKRHYKTLQEKIAALKEAQLLQEQQALSDQQKQKKKPRPPELDDGISIKSNDPFQKQEHRQSLRSLRHSVQGNSTSELYPQRRLSKNSEESFNMNQSNGDELSSSFYKLSINGYKRYLERRENYGSTQPTFNQGQTRYQHMQGNAAYQHPFHQYKHYYNTLPQSSPIPQHSPISQSNPLIQQTSSTSPDLSFNSKYNSRYYQTIGSPHHLHAYSKYISPNTAISLHRQSSPHSDINLSKYQYSTSISPQNSPILKSLSADPTCNTTLNPHQLQPHQQYEQNAGLGGCWRRKENGEIIWCNTISNDSTWRRDKRFGSLDRRKNRKITKRVSPNAESRTATVAAIPHSSEIKPSTMHSPQVHARHSDDRQLVRTQSLGSVGVQTSDSVWRSDDNSSCDSENHDISRNSMRRQKQKEWRETFLDSPELPVISGMGRCQSAVPPMLAPEEKYITPPTSSSSIISKLSFEIPAESNPHSRIPGTNLELFNNNIPKNCTVVQAGHCKPYHEETKPFEMSDFYKYSTKFKKSPSKNNLDDKSTFERPNIQKRNLNEYFENKNVFHHSVQSIEGSPQESISAGLLDNVEMRPVFSKLQESYSQDWYCQSPGEKENNNATLV